MSRRRAPVPIILLTAALAVNGIAVTLVLGIPHAVSWWGAFVTAGGAFLAHDAGWLTLALAGRAGQPPRWETRLIADALVILAGLILRVVGA